MVAGGGGADVFVKTPAVSDGRTMTGVFVGCDTAVLDGRSVAVWTETEVVVGRGVAVAVLPVTGIPGRLVAVGGIRVWVGVRVGVGVMVAVFVLVGVSVMVGVKVDVGVLLDVAV